MASDWGQDFVDDTPIEYILTVPAVWSDKAKSDTLFCASQAGFGDASNIRLITEPEAAAVWTFHQLPDVMVKKDDIFITVDAGGGTVDLTTYQVAATSPVLSVDEVTEGGGGLCGSAYLNRRFEELIKTKISKQLETLSKKEYGDALDEIQRAFNDDIKPDFGTTDEVGKTYFPGTELTCSPVPPIVADNAEAGIQDGRCTITTEEMKTVFDAVIRNILGLITDQVEKVEESHGDKEISAILLVGGFGSSGYLRQQIEEHFDGSAMPKINVIQPVHAWSAVTRGAMLRGIQGNIVEKRIIRAAYGIAARVVWDPAVHESDKYKRAAQSLKIWDDLEQKWKCSDSMEWYVKKGESFTKEKVVKVSFYRNLSSLDNLVFKTSMITWAGNGEIPLFKNNDCRIVATLSADLSAVSKDEFKLVTSANGDYYRVDYDIEMTFEAAISFRLVFNSSIIGGLTVDYGKR
ncbi:hypothetical protein GQ53DRAFT_792192 [Thozetella sp. PMI_491]|nr:hypothetical protein GQ53DRAFT_792192 [Thozetella sp. PMI_491]